MKKYKVLIKGNYKFAIRYSKQMTAISKATYNSTITEKK